MTDDNIEETETSDRVRDKVRRVLLGDGEPDPQSRDPDSFSSGGYFGVQKSGEVERREPPRDNLRKYWRQYETTGMVRKSINTFANDVIEPGYSVKAEDEELERRLNEWLKEGAIMNGAADKDFAMLLEDAIKQREVRGTALVEIVPQKGNPDGIWGFRLINVETVNALEHDGSGMLIQPSETDLDEVPVTRRGEAAAYIQYDDTAFAGPFDEDDVPLSQNDVIKMVRDGDTYDIFGTSRFEGVSNDIDILEQILDDNAEAIAAKGHPYWIFKMGEPNGDEDNPRRGVWPKDKIEDLADEHKAKNYEAGQKDFLPGDVGVDVVHGETADIQPTIKHHTERILSAMPTPKFMVGFADAVNRDITSEQSKAYQTQVQKVRNELESSFEPALERKAKEWGFAESAESIELRIERDTKESPLRNENFNAQEFKALAEGLRSMEESGAVSNDEVREQFLGLPPQSDEETNSDTEQTDNESDGQSE